MKTFGYILAGYAAVLALAGSSIGRVIHGVLMAHVLHYLHLDAIIHAFLVW